MLLCLVCHHSGPTKQGHPNPAVPCRPLPTADALLGGQALPSAGASIHSGVSSARRSLAFILEASFPPQAGTHLWASQKQALELRASRVDLSPSMGLHPWQHR